MFTFNDIAHCSLLRLQKQNPSGWVVSTTEICFLMVWSLGSSSSRCQPIWFLVEDLFLACTGLPLCVLTCQGERVWMSSWVQSLIRTLILLDQGSILMTSPNLNLKIWRSFSLSTLQTMSNLVLKRTLKVWLMIVLDCGSWTYPSQQRRGIEMGSHQHMGSPHPVSLN